MKALSERRTEGKHVPFQRYIITEHEEIESDRKLPSYSRGFVQDAPRSKCITTEKVLYRMVQDDG